MSSTPQDNPNPPAMTPDPQMLMSERLASIGVLATGVAHEINNPLAYVASNLHFIQNAMLKLPESTVKPLMMDAIGDALHGAERIRQIVSDLRTFARADSETLEPVRLHAVIDGAINMAWNEIRHRSRLLKDFEGDQWVYGNPSRLSQIVLNLLINAAHSMEPGRADENQIRLVTRRLSDNRVLFECRDTGAGIAAEHLPRLFEPFFTTKTLDRGTGLGLYVSQSLARAMGGEITVESTLGTGSVFRVSFPLANAAESAKPETPLKSTRRAQVLVVDDDAEIRQALKRTLSDLHDVVTVDSVAAALNSLAAGARYDAFVCDVMMPNQTGFDFYDQLKLQGRGDEDRVLFMTAGVFTGKAREFLDDLGPARVMDKPFSRSILIEALGTLTLAK